MKKLKLTTLTLFALATAPLQKSHALMYATPASGNPSKMTARFGIGCSGVRVAPDLVMTADTCPVYTSDRIKIDGTTFKPLSGGASVGRGMKLVPISQLNSTGAWTPITAAPTAKFATSNISLGSAANFVAGSDRFPGYEYEDAYLWFIGLNSQTPIPGINFSQNTTALYYTFYLDKYDRGAPGFSPAGELLGVLYALLSPYTQMFTAPQWMVSNLVEYTPHIVETMLASETNCNLKVYDEVLNTDVSSAEISSGHPPVVVKWDPATESINPKFTFSRESRWKNLGWEIDSGLLKKNFEARATVQFEVKSNTVLYPAGNAHSSSIQKTQVVKVSEEKVERYAGTEDFSMTGAVTVDLYYNGFKVGYCGDTVPFHIIPK